MNSVFKDFPLSFDSFIHQKQVIEGPHFQCSAALLRLIWCQCYQSEKKNKIYISRLLYVKAKHSKILFPVYNR